MTHEQANSLVPGQQVYFCVIAANDDVSGLIFGTGAYLGRRDEGHLIIGTGKGKTDAVEYQVFYTAASMTAYLERYFHIVNEKLKDGAI